MSLNDLRDRRNANRVVTGMACAFLVFVAAVISVYTVLK